MSSALSPTPPPPATPSLMSQCWFADVNMRRGRGSSTSLAKGAAAVDEQQQDEGGGAQVAATSSSSSSSNMSRTRISSSTRISDIMPSARGSSLGLFETVFEQHCFGANRPAIFRGLSSALSAAVAAAPPPTPPPPSAPADAATLGISQSSSSTPFSFDVAHLQSLLGCPDALLALFGEDHKVPIILEEGEGNNARDKMGAGGGGGARGKGSHAEEEAARRRERPLPSRTYTATSELASETESGGDGSGGDDCGAVTTLGGFLKAANGSSLSHHHCDSNNTDSTHCTQSSSISTYMYLKDWHYLLERDAALRLAGATMAEGPTSSPPSPSFSLLLLLLHQNALYTCPRPLQSDWLNEYCLRRVEESKEEKEEGNVAAVGDNEAPCLTANATDDDDDDGDDAPHYSPPKPLNDNDLFGKHYNNTLLLLMKAREKEMRRRVGDAATDGEKNGPPPSATSHLPPSPTPHATPHAAVDADVDVTTGDYRFVYCGVVGSTTPFHMDVFGSYSWSLNVMGRKRWRFYLPLAEGEGDEEGVGGDSGRAANGAAGGGGLQQIDPLPQLCECVDAAVGAAVDVTASIFPPLQVYNEYLVAAEDGCDAAALPPPRALRVTNSTATAASSSAVGVRADHSSSSHHNCGADCYYRPYYEVIQRPGDLVFVPSCVYHCVENIAEDDDDANANDGDGAEAKPDDDGATLSSPSSTPNAAPPPFSPSPFVISVNHNWFNRHNILTHVVPLLCREARASHGSVEADTRDIFRMTPSLPSADADDEEEDGEGGVPAANGCSSVVGGESLLSFDQIIERLVGGGGAVVGGGKGSACAQPSSSSASPCSATTAASPSPSPSSSFVAALLSQPCYTSSLEGHDAIFGRGGEGGGEERRWGGFAAAAAAAVAAHHHPPPTPLHHAPTVLQQEQQRLLLRALIATDGWLSHVEFMLQCGASWNMLSMRRLLVYIAAARGRDRDGDGDGGRDNRLLDRTVALEAIRMIDETIAFIVMDR